MPPTGFLTPWFRRCILWGGILAGFGLAAKASEEGGFIPFDPRWDFPHYLSFRPGDGESVDLDAPRFSWPHEPGMTVERNSKLTQREFVLQISATPDFDKSAVSRRVAENFFNALAPLGSGTWHWRVGYAVPNRPPDSWSAVRTFHIPENAVKWDRTIIDRAADVLARRPRPRSGPANNDWSGWHERLRVDPSTKAELARLISRADQATNSGWWNEFPSDDRSTAVPAANRRRFSAELGDIAEVLAETTFVYKLTGDARYRKAIELVLRAAQFKPGGETSPEGHGASDKWGTRWLVAFSMVYDWAWHDLSTEERAALREAIRWRLELVMLDGFAWRARHGVHPVGVAVFPQSHPFENFYHAALAAILMGGELPLASELVGPVLSYLTGVGTGFGPEGASNEAGGYAFFKTKQVFAAAVLAELSLPELGLERVPWFTRLGLFLSDLAPPGLGRQGFGDYTRDMSAPARKGDLLGSMMLATVVTRDSRLRGVWSSLEAAGVEPRNLDSALFLAAAARNGVPLPGGSHVANSFLAEPGWFFAGTHSSLDYSHANDAIRIVAMGRPRGGYSHSHAKDGAFVWHAYGATLAAGGGATVYADPYSRNGFSHNGILVDGRSAAVRDFETPYPIAARPLLWRKSTQAVTWSIDLTGAFLVPPEQSRGTYEFLRKMPNNDWGHEGLQRWIRHFALLEGGDVVIVDDLAMRADAQPARFSWVYHIPQFVRVESDKESELLARYTIGNVEARVFQRSMHATTISRLRGADTLINPITGTNYMDGIMEAFGRRTRSLAEADFSGEVIVATTEAKRATRFVTVLTANRAGETQTTVAFDTDDTISLKKGEGKRRVSLGATGGDVNLEIDAVRKHAATSDPYRLPEEGSPEHISVGGSKFTVEWLRSDRFNDNAWLNRWWVETQGASVYRTSNGLQVQPPKAEAAETRIWLRAAPPRQWVVRAKIAGWSARSAPPLTFIFGAMEKDLSPLRFGRTGAAADLAEIKSREIILSEGDPATLGSKPNELIEILLVGAGAKVHVFLNGRLFRTVARQEAAGERLGFGLGSGTISIEQVDVGILREGHFENVPH